MTVVLCPWQMSHLAVWKRTASQWVWGSPSSGFAGKSVDAAEVTGEGLPWEADGPVAEEESMELSAAGNAKDAPRDVG